ncbi:MAG: alpha/beta hydrolase, partial [Flavobacterium sp.]
MKKLQFFLLTVCILFSIASHAQQAFKVEVVGKGNPVLFFAGFGCTGEVWKAAVFELSKQYECH